MNTAEPAPQTRHENPEIAAMLRRVIRRYGERIGHSDPYDLAEALELRDQLDRAIAAAVTCQHAAGYSWAAIGEGAGMTRQAAQQRWG